MIDLKNIKIDVVDKYGKPLSPTNGLIARTLIKREKAVWLVKGKKIKLIKTNQDWKKTKQRVIREENRVCYICGYVIPEDVPATVDHVDPKSKTGKDDRDNLRCCCKRCNDFKANMDIETFYNQVRKDRTKYSYINLKHLKIVVEFFKNK